MGSQMLLTELQSPKPLPESPSQTINLRVVSLRPQTLYVCQTPGLNKEDENSACCLLLQIGQDTITNTVLVEMVLQLIHEAFFNQLRTIQQLGYIVNAGLALSKGVLALRFIIQSSSHPASHQHQIGEVQEPHRGDASPLERDFPTPL